MQSLKNKYLIIVSILCILVAGNSHARWGRGGGGGWGWGGFGLGLASGALVTAAAQPRTVYYEPAPAVREIHYVDAEPRRKKTSQIGRLEKRLDQLEAENTALKEQMAATAAAA